jgi:hypothetical protein
MSSAVVSTSAALGRPFLFDADPQRQVSRQEAKKPVRTRESVISQVLQSTIKNQSTISLAPASRLEIRPAVEMVSSGIAALDSLTGGLPRGCLTEICGPDSSGRTSVMLGAIAAATRRGEFCALLDAGDTLDPKSAATAGIDLDRFLWVRCGEDSPQRHRGTEKTKSKNIAPDALVRGRASDASEHRLEQVLRATDLLLESGGFGLIVLDLADLPPQSARRMPLTTWFRFRRAVEHKPTILLAIEQQPIAGSCSSLLLQLGTPATLPDDAHDSTKKTPSSCARPDSRGRLSLHGHFSPDTRPTHVHLLSGLKINIAMICSRLDRKSAHSVTFETKTAWAG